MSAVREKKCSVSPEITVIRWLLRFRMWRAQVMPAMPFPKITMCIGRSVQINLQGHKKPFAGILARAVAVRAAKPAPPNPRRQTRAAKPAPPNPRRQTRAAKPAPPI